MQSTTRIENVVEQVNKSLPFEFREPMRAAFHEPLMNAVEWGRHLNPEPVAQIDSTRLKTKSRYSSTSVEPRAQVFDCGVLRSYVAFPAMIFAASEAAQIDDDGNEQDQQIKACRRQSTVHHPGIHESGQRQKQKAK